MVRHGEACCKCGDNSLPILLTRANDTKLWFRSARVHSTVRSEEIGAPLRIKLRTLMQLKLLSNFFAKWWIQQIWRGHRGRLAGHRQCRRAKRVRARSVTLRVARRQSTVPGLGLLIFVLVEHAGPEAFPWKVQSDGPGVVNYESPTRRKPLLDWKAYRVVNKPIAPSAS